jgi:hypothetical protein
MGACPRIGILDGSEVGDGERKKAEDLLSAAREREGY